MSRCGFPSCGDEWLIALMMNAKNYFRFSILALIAGLSCLAALKNGSGDVQAAVTLLYFQGQHNVDSVMLEWATATELSTAYFYIERASAQDGPYNMLDEIGLVPSEAPPDGLSGATYQRRDQDNVNAHEVYWYVLVEVDSQGEENRTQPIRVAIEDAQQTVTPTRTATPRPTTAPSGTASASPTATPTSKLQVTPNPADPTTTSQATRVLSARSTPTFESTLTDQSASSPIAVEGDQAVTASQEQAVITSAGNDSQQSMAEAPVGEPDIAGQAYPPGPPTPQVFPTNSYPDPVVSRDHTNGTPIPNIGFSSQAENGDLSDESQAPANSPFLGTVFLWIGFVAALIIFVSAAAGAIYYYNRQRTGSN